MNGENIRQLIEMWNMDTSGEDQLRIMLLKSRILMFNLGLTFTDGKYRCTPEDIHPDFREEFVNALRVIDYPPISFAE